MKIILLTLLACCGLLACQKDYRDSFPSAPPRPAQPAPAAKGRLVRMQQGTRPGSDTVYLISYDSLNRIGTVKDSAGGATLVATYNAAGKLSSIVETGPTTPASASFSYNAAGLLTLVEYTIAGSRQQLRFQYVNNVVSRKDYYTEGSSRGTFELFDSFVYGVSGGNITSIKQYNAASQFVDERKVSFGQEANPFRQLCLFNFANILGAEDIMNTETYFSANILTGYTSSSQVQTVSTVFTQQKPVRMNAAYKDPFTSYQFTWFFTYD